MAEKILNTRVQLKYDTFKNWTDYNPELLSGEVAIAILGNAHTTTSPDNGTHPVVMKVGPGKYNSLPFVSALAADVYEWAKAATKPSYTASEIGGLKEYVEGISDIDTNTQYSFEITDGKLVIKKKDIGDAEFVAYGQPLDIVTPGELTTALANYYTKDEIDDLLEAIEREIGAIDTGVHSVVLTGGANNGTLKLTVDGTPTDNIAVTGLQDAAYTTVAALNATAKDYADAVEAKLPTSADYGVLSVTKGDNTITIGGTAQNPTIAVTANTFDAHGAAAAVQSNLTDYSNLHANDYSNAKIDELIAEAKVYADEKDDDHAHTHASGTGIKVDNAGGLSGVVTANLNVAFELEGKVIKLYDKDDATKTAIATLDATEFIADGMLASVTPDVENNTLIFAWNTDAGIKETEIPLSSIADIYTGANGNEVNVAVSNTNVISASLNSAITEKIGHGETAYGWGDHSKAGYAANADLTKVINGTTPVAKATNADQLGGQVPSYYATAASVTDITKAGGEIDKKIAALDKTVTGMDAGKTIKTLTETDGIIAAEFQDIEITKSQISDFDESDYATAASVTNIVKDNGTIDTKITAYDTSKNFGDIITHDAAEFATAEQGAKADTAIQGVELEAYLTQYDSNNNDTWETELHMDFSVDGQNQTSVVISTRDSDGIVFKESPSYSGAPENMDGFIEVGLAPWAQKKLADSVQNIEVGTGLKVVNEQKGLDDVDGGVPQGITAKHTTIEIDDTVTFIFNCGSASEIF